MEEYERSAHDAVNRPADAGQGTAVQKSKKRSFFTRPLGILLLVAAAFIIGNMLASGNYIKLSGASSEYKPVSGLPEDLNYDSVEELYDKLRTSYDGKLTESQVIDGLKKGLAESTGDPYTEYYTAKKSSDFYSQLNNEFSGIGAELGKDKDDNLIIVAPIAGFPAEKAGMRSQDIITTINGKSTSGMSIDEAVSHIRGEKGTKVKLQVVRNKSTPLSFEITRDTIKITSVKSEILDGNIGYVSISNFAEDTSDQMAKVAQEFKDKGVKGVVLDLRGNPGGLLDAAVSVSGQWLPQGKKILEEKRGGKVVIETYDSEGPGVLAGVPTVVLMNEGSASASEIVAGALRDNNAARIIGVKSYGKGVVQQTLCVKGFRNDKGGCSEDMLKVTVASWYRPNGQNINHQGIKPDQEVKLSDADIEAQNDTQKNAALDYLKSKQ